MRAARPGLVAGSRMSAVPVVVALTGSRADLGRAEAIAERLASRVVAPDQIPEEEICLFVDADSLELGRAGRGQPRVAISWTRRRPGGGKRDPLLRAVGSPGRNVLDATAGFGHDCFVLAQNGYQVVATEREAVVAIMLEDALARAQRDPLLSDVASQISFYACDSRERMTSKRQTFDTIYLDPMYPPKRKRSALPRLPIQLLHRLIGEDDDVQSLFDAARLAARDRVVIKRPLHAAPLSVEPTVQYHGKLVRYDVYYTPKSDV